MLISYLTGIWFQVVFGRERETEETLGVKKRIPFSDESKALAAQLVSVHQGHLSFTKGGNLKSDTICLTIERNFIRRNGRFRHSLKHY